MESLQFVEFLLFVELLLSLQFVELDVAFSALLYALFALFCVLFILLFVSFFAISTPSGSCSALTLIGYRNSMSFLSSFIRNLSKKF